MRRSLTVALVLLASIASAQPQNQPLVQAGDVTLLGTFTLPNGGPDSLAVEGATVYAGYGKCVAVFSLPVLGGTATLLNPCTPLPNIDQVHPVDRNVIVGGILPYLGKFVVDAYVYYDGSAGATRSHWIGSTLTNFTGPFTVSTLAALGQERPALVAGGMGVIPPEWRTLLGGPALTGLCCVPIISRTSYGPSVSVFDPAHLDGRPVVPATMLIGYPVEHRTLGPWEGVSQYYGGTNQLGGVGFPAGTRSILFTGRHGDSWCYGPATADKALVGTIYGGDPLPRCYDPTDFNRGNHGPPYRPTMWAYDANDLIAVKAGTKKPWDVTPYAKWTLPGMPIDGVQNLMRAGYYDQATKRYYVGMNDSNKVWVFAIGLGDAQPPPPTATDDTYTTASVPFTAAAPGVLENDNLNGNTDVTAVLVSGTSFALNPNGGFTFAPAAGFTGAASFTYQARSAANGSSNTATATVTVQASLTANVMITPSVTHQTMRGWEVAGEMNQLRTDYQAFQSAALDAVVNAGINRAALGVRSGSEHTRDAFGDWMAAGHPATKADGTSCVWPADGADPYCRWRFARYETINDNADPNAAAAGRFHWTEIDTAIDRLHNPLRAKLAAKGETLHVALVYVAFYNMVTTGAVNVHQTPAEYAEFMTELFLHIKGKYGWVPDSIDTVLEPDNVVNWGGVLLGQAIAATAQRFAAAGLAPPVFSVPSTTNMTTAPAWFDQLWTVTAARPYVKELSYHRYSGVSTASLQAIASKAQAAGVSTAMLEWWDNANTHETLHEDLTVGRNSAWQQNEIVNIVGAYPTENTQAISRIDPATPTVAVLYPRTRFYSQYYRAARMGAVRIGATSTLGTLAPLAFRNLDGKQSVVVKASGAASISIGGLPAGAYGITYTASSTGSPYVADLTGSHPDQTITAGQVLTTSIPGYGVLSVIGKTGGVVLDKNCVFDTAVTTSPWMPLVCPVPPAKPEQFATETTTITVKEQPTGNGKACPVTSTRQVFQACTPLTGATTVTLTTGGTTLTCTLTGTVWACK